MGSIAHGLTFLKKHTSFFLNADDPSRNAPSELSMESTKTSMRKILREIPSLLHPAYASGLEIHISI